MFGENFDFWKSGHGLDVHGSGGFRHHHGHHVHGVPYFRPACLVMLFAWKWAMKHKVNCIFYDVQ
jgi:hypothetical protein